MAAFFGFQFVARSISRSCAGGARSRPGSPSRSWAIDLVLAPLLTPGSRRSFRQRRRSWSPASSARRRPSVCCSAWTADSTLLRPASLAPAGRCRVRARLRPAHPAATDGVVDAEHGVAGGVLYTAFQFGAALGVAGVTIALSAPGSRHRPLPTSLRDSDVLNHAPAVVMSVALLRAASATSPVGCGLSR